MNAAVKALSYRATTLNLAFPIIVTRKYVFLLSLALVVLCSAFGLVYQKDVNRRLMTQLGTLQNVNTELHNRWTQSLLQKMKLADQSRIIAIAKTKMDMDLPAPKSVKMV
jgi:cell division protein FtsL